MDEKYKSLDEWAKANGNERPYTDSNQKRQTNQNISSREDYRTSQRTVNSGNERSAMPHKRQKITYPDYVTRAEKVMRLIGQSDNRDSSKMRFDLTTSKIRGILTMFNQIYNDVVKYPDEKLSEDLQERIKYLRVRMVYEAGRETAVEQFLYEADLLSEVSTIGESKKKFIDAARYMEALVAYHRYLGGRDD